MLAIIRIIMHKLRTRWRGWASLALLTGLAGGVVLAAVAGALRTDSAYPRLLNQSNAADVLISPAGAGVGGFDAALARVPGAAVTAAVIGLQVVPLRTDGTVDNSATTLASLDGGAGRQVEIPKLLAGRLPAPGSPGEIAINQIAARNMHVWAGDTVRMAALKSEDQAHPRLLTERVVGVFVDRGSVVTVTELDQVSTIWASPALYRELGRGYEAFDGAYVKLRPGASLARYSASVQRLAKRFPSTGGQVFVADESVQAATVERAIRPQAVALALFALALALCALLIVGQVAARLLLAAAADNGTLAGLGMTRRQLFAAGLLEVLITATSGAAVTVIVAIAASPLTPIGPARLAEPILGTVLAMIAVIATMTFGTSLRTLVSHPALTPRRGSTA